MSARARVSAWAGLLLCGAAPAAAAPVTFQVNMSAQAALGNFKPATDSVFVAGDAINGWSTTASELTPSSTDPNLWAGTFEVPGAAKSTVQYKFVMNTASGVTWEGNVGPGGGAGNRTFTLAGTDQTLPVVFFNNVTNSTSVSADVTFRVNMSIQVMVGNFDPVAGALNVAGEFNGWSTSATALTNSVTDTNVWITTVHLSGAAGSSVNYKFVMNGSTWEGNVGPNGAQNRAVALQATNQTLPVVFFNNLPAAPTVFPLTFQVNLAALIARGTFQPDGGAVSVAGDLLNNWNATSCPLTNSVTDTNVWAGMFEMTATPGHVLQYKFVLNGGTTWETGDNRIYTIPSTNSQTLPVSFFNNLDNLGPVALGPISGGQTALSWTAGPLIRLQSAADLNRGPWQNVPDTQGKDSVKVTVGPGRSFFRLIGP